MAIIKKIILENDKKKNYSADFSEALSLEQDWFYF